MTTRLRLECGHNVRPEDAQSGGVDCRECDHRWIPAIARPGRCTPTFTAQTTPKALLSEHQTTAWARLVVTAGEVVFSEVATGFIRSASQSRSVTIVPGRLHSIEPTADAVFHVQFFNLPEPASHARFV